MRCFVHQDVEAIGACNVCGSAVCASCGVSRVATVTCPKCVAAGRGALIRVLGVAAALCIIGPLAVMAAFGALNAGYFWSILIGVAALALVFAIALRPSLR